MSKEAVVFRKVAPMLLVDDLERGIQFYREVGLALKIV